MQQKMSRKFIWLKFSIIIDKHLKGIKLKRGFRCVLFYFRDAKVSGNYRELLRSVKINICMVVSKFLVSRCKLLKAEVWNKSESAKWMKLFAKEPIVELNDKTEKKQNNCVRKEFLILNNIIDHLMLHASENELKFDCKPSRRITAFIVVSAKDNRNNIQISHFYQPVFLPMPTWICLKITRAREYKWRNTSSYFLWNWRWITKSIHEFIYGCSEKCWKYIRSFPFLFCFRSAL